MIDHDQRHAAALHEAAHAVLALTVGFKVGYVSIIPRDGEDEQGHTQVLAPADWQKQEDSHYRPVDLSDPQLEDNVRRWLTWTLAPIAGQAVFGADPGCIDDHDAAWSLVGCLGLGEREEGELMGGVLAEARKFVRSYEWLIRIVANHIAEVGSMGSQQLHQVWTMRRELLASMSPN